MSIKTNNELLSERIKSFRDNSKLTQQAVADHCNVALRTYQRIESGERDGCLSFWLHLAELYNVTLDEIFNTNKAS